MADDGHAETVAPAAPVPSIAAHSYGNGHSRGETLPVNTELNPKFNGNVTNSPVPESLTSPRLYTPNPFSRHNTSLDIDDYFVRDLPVTSGPLR